MTWLRHAALGAAVAAIAAACSAFDEPPETPGGVDGGDAGGDAGSDGETSAEDASSTSDADVNDADPGDVRVDGGKCLPPPTPSGCAGAILTPLDFKLELAPVGWTTDVLAGTVVRVPKPGPCSPGDGFLRAETTLPNDAEASGNAYIAKSFDGSYKSAHVAFDFRGPEPLTDGYANVGCTLVLRGTASSQPRTSVRLTLSDDKLVYGASVRGIDGGLQINGPQLSLDQAFAPNAGGWHRLDATFFIQPDTVTVAASYDGKTVGDFSATLLTPATRIEIECGIDYSDGVNASFRHDIDDVFFELCPAQ